MIKDTFTKVLAKRLEQKGVGKLGETIFANNVPSHVLLAVGIYSKLTGATIDYELPGYRKTGFQVVVRCQDYEVGEELMHKAVQALTILMTENLPGHEVKYMRPRHELVSFPVSSGNLTEFSVNFDVAYVIV
jgi:hypothetical protein